VVGSGGRTPVGAETVSRLAVVGESKSPNHPGVWGKGSAWTGVFGSSIDQTGVTGTSEKCVGVWAETRGKDHPALFAKSAGDAQGVSKGTSR